MRNRLTLAFAMVAGFIGGMVSHVPALVHAQTPTPVAPEIRAQKFLLVDENGTPRGVFGFRSDGTPELQVRNKNPKGLAKIIQAEVGSPQWLGVVEKACFPICDPHTRSAAQTDPCKLSIARPRG